MRFEHVWALFRPFKISDAEHAKVRLRVNPTGVGDDAASTIRQANALIASLEAKVGILLTHVSMMIAVTGLMLAISGDVLWYEIVLACELGLYLMLALLCIRSQLHFGSEDYDAVCVKGSDKMKESPYHVYRTIVYGELLFREGLFRLIQRALYVLTFLLILTVFYGLLADEFGVLSGGKS